MSESELFFSLLRITAAQTLRAAGLTTAKPSVVDAFTGLSRRLYLPVYYSRLRAHVSTDSYLLCRRFLSLLFFIPCPHPPRHLTPHLLLPLLSSSQLPTPAADVPQT